MGGRDKCTIHNQYPLWYAHYDGQANFDDWEKSKFGGWAQPTLKQYAGDATLCGFKLDLSFY